MLDPSRHLIFTIYSELDSGTNLEWIYHSLRNFCRSIRIVCTLSRVVS